VNVMILGAKPAPSVQTGQCPAHHGLFERIGRIEKCLAKIEKALTADRKARKTGDSETRKAGTARTGSKAQAT